MHRIKPGQREWIRLCVLNLQVVYRDTGGKDVTDFPFALSTLTCEMSGNDVDGHEVIDRSS